MMKRTFAGGVASIPPGTYVEPASASAVRVSEPPPRRFVSTTGDDSFDGRWDRPKATVAGAASALPANAGIIQLMPGTHDLGGGAGPGVALDGARQLVGSGRSATTVVYAGSGGAVVINSGAGVVTLDVLVADLTIDCGDVGAYGVVCGDPGASNNKTGSGTARDVLVTNALTAGMRLRATAGFSADRVILTGNVGDGLIVDNEINNANTTATFRDLWSKANGKRGAYIKNGLNLRFSRPIFETNGEEGCLIERADNASLVLRDVVLDQGHFESNNNGRGSGAYGQFKQVCLGSSTIQGTELRHPYFTLPGTGNHNVVLDRGQLIVWYPDMTGTNLVSASSSNVLTVYDDGDPLADWPLPGSAASAVFMVARSGAFAVYSNLSGTVSKVFEAGTGSKMGLHGTAPVTQGTALTDLGTGGTSTVAQLEAAINAINNRLRRTGYIAT